MRRVTAWLSWFACLFVLWLLLVGTAQDVERIAGLCAAAIGATAADVVRSHRLLRYRVEWRWLRLAWKPLYPVVPEFFLVLAALVRRPNGRFRTIEFPAGGERAVDAGRRAFAVVAGSLARIGSSSTSIRQAGCRCALPASTRSWDCRRPGR